MVKQLIERLVRDGEDPSTKDAEAFIKNVATVTVEGVSRAVKRLS